MKHRPRFRPYVDKFRYHAGFLYEGCVIDEHGRRVLTVPVKVSHARAVLVAIEAFRHVNGGPCPEREAAILPPPKERP
jgi:hypothetical protein